MFPSSAPSIFFPFSLGFKRLEKPFPGYIVSTVCGGLAEGSLAVNEAGEDTDLEFYLESGWTHEQYVRDALKKQGSREF